MMYGIKNVMAYSSKYTSVKFKKNLKIFIKNEFI
jgi:hypothetical protein